MHILLIGLLLKWAMAAACAQEAGGTARDLGDAVGRWTRLGDELGDGYANWHTLAIMHIAMHDALNAALPRFRRWAPPGPGERGGSGTPEAAMAAAARQVLLSLHADRAARIESVFMEAMEGVVPGPVRDGGVELGSEIGVAWVRRRASDGFTPTHPFPAVTLPGAWRPTPPTNRSSNTTKTRPFLSDERIEPGAPEPPPLGSPVYAAEVGETQRIGGAASLLRAPSGTQAAVFWAYQSSQRGYMDLGIRLLAEHPRPNGLWDDARVMSQLASALADSAVIIWAEKEHFNRWRPITAIRQGGFGVVADQEWSPLIETPHFPEYPAGHTSDCFTGAGMLATVFGDAAGPITYRALGGQTPRMEPANGMGQHAQGNQPAMVERSFLGLWQSAAECAQSRIWAGAHVRSSNEEAKRVAKAIVRRAASAVPPLP